MPTPAIDRHSSPGIAPHVLHLLSIGFMPAMVPTMKHPIRDTRAEWTDTQAAMRAAAQEVAVAAVMVQIAAAAAIVALVFVVARANGGTVRV